MIEPQTLIDGRYRVLSRLGSGGMADVYLAQDELLGRQVAVKVLHHHFAEDHEFVERFRREASSAAGLSHPNIVAIFDRGEWNGTYYIAMEYVNGRSLKSIVREIGAVDPAAAIDVVVQVLQAAGFAHRHGVVHRDLKPHNVLLDEDGRARVTDFGIARAGASDMTLTGSIMGTAQYLSPEQAQGHPVSAASDLYSIGVILYELLTGTVPFEGETAVAIAYKQVSAEPRAPSQLNPYLPPSLDAVVMRALAKDPGARYHDADEMVAALEREREALPAYSAVAQGGAAPAGEGAGPEPLPPATGALLLAPVEGLEEDPQAAAEDRRRRRRIILWALAGTIAAAAVAVALILLLSPAGRVTVPDVTGQSEQAAGATLRRAGLTPVPTLSASSTVAAGLVIRQTPVPGAVADRGSHVKIVVSGGPASAALPDVKGLTAGQATARLRKEGFKPTTRSQHSSAVAAERVIGTNPPAGTETQLGSQVVVLVSSGPATVTVPDVVGQSQAAAEATLANAGLSVGNITKGSSTTEGPGTVLSQTPGHGSTAHAGDTVDLVVAQASKEVTVPNVIGKSEALASAKLGEVGLTPKPVSTTTSEPARVGVVLGQSPAAGTHTRKGSTVTIKVGVLGTTTTPTTPTTTTPTTTTPAAPSP